MCHMHVESPEHAIVQCASNLQAHLVRQEFFIHVKQPAFQLVYPLTLLALGGVSPRKTHF